VLGHVGASPFSGSLCLQELKQRLQHLHVA